MPVKRTCVVCKKDIFYKKSHSLKIKNSSCSKKCLAEFRKNHYLGSSNPNKKHNFDTNLLSKIDTENKAYLLGWIASDGSIRRGTVCISIHKKDWRLLEQLSMFVYNKKNIQFKKNKPMVDITFNSLEFQKDVCKHLGIPPGKKSFTVTYPDIPSDLDRHFIRGLFDGDGCVISPGSKITMPRCSIASGSLEMVNRIVAVAKRGASVSKIIGKTGNLQYTIEWSGNNALDFLSWIYDDSSISLSRKKELYNAWRCWVPSLSGTGRSGKLGVLKWNKNDPNAIAPYKPNASDVGYDLTLIKKVKDIDELTALYDTGIKISFDYGWYGMVVPRSSMGKSQFFMSNFIGIIDRNYRGTIMVLIRKLDKSSPEPTLPLRAVQIIPTPIQHFILEEVSEFAPTERGTNGFGSSGR